MSHLSSVLILIGILISLPSLYLFLILKPHLFARSPWYVRGGLILALLVLGITLAQAISDLVALPLQLAIICSYPLIALAALSNSREHQRSLDAWQEDKLHKLQPQRTFIPEWIMVEAMVRYWRERQFRKRMRQNQQSKSEPPSSDRKP